MYRRFVDPIAVAWQSFHRAPLPPVLGQPAKSPLGLPIAAPVLTPNTAPAPKLLRGKNGGATYHGTPCRKAGHTLRYVHGGACVVCMNTRYGSKRGKGV